jgi:hypothetical protein
LYIWRLDGAVCVDVAVGRMTTSVLEVDVDTPRAVHALLSSDVSIRKNQVKGLECGVSAFNSM